MQAKAASSPVRALASVTPNAPPITDQVSAQRTRRRSTNGSAPGTIFHSGRSRHCGWAARHPFGAMSDPSRSEEHTSELQSRSDLVCRLLLEKKKEQIKEHNHLSFDLNAGDYTNANRFRLNI